VTVQDDNSHTGVGLAIVQRIVESAGGRVWIEENMPHGTVVIVELKNTLG
jgi:signal transduction histidine kinase